MASLGDFVAEQTIAATNKVNEFRERRGVPPIKVDIEKTKAAQNFLENWIFSLF
jgi:uncharacterized protein YkwD